MKAILGMKARDIITGFEGRVIGRVEYLTGCNQALLVGRVEDGKGGNPPDSHWLDEQRLERLGTDVIVLDNGLTPGCDKQAPRI